jgi:small subunit ribosomal protein S15
MYLTKEIKEEIFAQHGEKQTLEAEEASFTLLSELALNGALEKNRHDYNTERSLVLLVGKRRSLLDYLKRKEINRY